MPAQLEEITAEFLYERLRFDNPDGDVVIAEAHANGTINAPIVIKGPADVDELRPQHTYRFYGRWADYHNRRTGDVEKQFHFQTFVAAQPHNRDGIIAYLRHAGQGLGFGAARAAAMWEIFGSNAVQVMREQPERVLAALEKQGLRLAAKACNQMVASLTREQALENCTIELTDLLAGRGFPKTTARKAIQEWGNRAAAVIRHDPYKLMRFRGCGFKLCDQLYLHLGLPPGRLKRQALAAWYALSSNSDGHTYFPRRAAEFGIRATVAGAELRIDKAIELGLRSGLLRELHTKGINGPIATDGDYSWLAIAEHADREARLAQLIANKTQESFTWPDIESIKNIDGEQPGVLAVCLCGPIAILGGRPGSGKTFTCANLIGAALACFGDGEIGIGAPTNLAAQRLSEVMAGYGVNIRARTWHSLLGRPMPEQAATGEQWRFNAKSPFPFRLIVGDEESMKDLEMMTAVFEACAKGTQILLIGDIRQLLPVGVGAPLRDMIAAGLPYGELRQIRRNSGGIVEACSAIADGLPWGSGDNLDIIEIDDEDQQFVEIIRQANRMRAAGIDPVWESRVIVARNEVRRAVNKLLQAELNPNPAIEGSPFRLHDKVICRDNQNFSIVDADASDPDNEISDSGKEVRIANGEIGKVLGVADKYFVVEVLAPKRVVHVPRGKMQADDADDGDGRADKTGTGCAWDLAYAITYHSSQGSEFPWAIVVASSRDGRMGSRELIYTGISRAKQRCVLVGRKSTFDAMCRRVALGQRKTLLKEQILLNLAQAELATM